MQRAAYGGQVSLGSRKRAAVREWQWRYEKRASRSTKRKMVFRFLTALHGKSRCLNKLDINYEYEREKPIDILIIFFVVIQG